MGILTLGIPLFLVVILLLAAFAVGVFFEKANTKKVAAIVAAVTAAKPATPAAK